ncbi:protein kinase C-binding protein NELL2-like [Xenia sp. Carnegie-2017]|uniref:protein kinase C-binding protein NELL2-like n=1 Tax=Xenia sp. Carnegie-2017 TaxID=2897299 RepID=UPI001F044B89|nr:protein kinase C-binding protein NELL2-like [Xenia sp. Carnegie-2017]
MAVIQIKKLCIFASTHDHDILPCFETVKYWQKVKVNITTTSLPPTTRPLENMHAITYRMEQFPKRCYTLKSIMDKKYTKKPQDCAQWCLQNDRCRAVTYSFTKTECTSSNRRRYCSRTRCLKKQLYWQKVKIKVLHTTIESARTTTIMETTENPLKVVWPEVGPKCFDYSYYVSNQTENRQKCLEICLEDKSCKFFVYDAYKKNCFLCKGVYKVKKSCGQPFKITVKDVNECAIGTHNCSKNSANCINRIGSFKCECKTGFYKKSGTCVKIPEVVWIPYLNGCFKNKTYFAHLKVESKEQCQFKCQIKDKCAVAEYISEKKLCKLATHYHYKSIYDCGRRSVLFIKAIIECDNIKKFCPPHSYCQSYSRNRICRCRTGYKENGNACYDVNECETYQNLCGENAKCLNTDGSYKCECLHGYQGNGELCIKETSSLKNMSTQNQDKKGALHELINLLNSSALPRFYLHSWLLFVAVLILSANN